MNKKQFMKLFLLIVGSSALSFLALYSLDDVANKTLGKLNEALPYLLAIMGALSFAMFTYIDNTAKDLTDLRNDFSDRSKYFVCQESLTRLKREIILNVALVAVVFIVDRAAQALALAVSTKILASEKWLFEAVSICLAASCFVIVMYALISQISGYFIAAEYREIIAKNRK
jgi:hypothetical protein